MQRVLGILGALGRRVPSGRAACLLVIIPASLLSAWGALAGQEDACFGYPEPIGSLSLDGGDNLLGGASMPADGKTLYYCVWQGSSRANWIMKASREDVGVPFEGGARLSTGGDPYRNVNIPGKRSYAPRISADGRWLYFGAVDQRAGLSTWNIWVARNSAPQDPEASFDEVALLPDVNGFEQGEADFPGCVSPDGRELFFTKRYLLHRARFNVAHEPLEGFHDIEQLAFLNSGFRCIHGPAISADGRYLVWSDAPNWWCGDTYRAGGHGLTDLWMAFRASGDPDAAFGPPVNLPAPPNSSDQEYWPWLWDDCEGTVSVLFSNSWSIRTAPSGCFGADPETRARLTISEGPGEGVVLDATSSTPAEAIVSYEWRLGSDSTGETPELVLDHPGRHLVTLRVATDGGTCDYHSETVKAPCPSGDVAPWTSANLGEPTFPGGAWFSRGESAGAEEDPCLEVCASGGAGVAGTNDQFHFVHQEVSGDAVLTARIAEIASQGQDGYVGLMVRESLEPTARYASVLVAGTGTKRFRFRFREVEGQQSSRVLGEIAVLPDAWIQIRRCGPDLVGLASPDGAAWTEIDRIRMEDAPDTLFAGVAALSADRLPDWTFAPMRATISDIELGAPPLESFARGDADADGEWNLTDAVYLFETLFRGGKLPDCFDAADADDSGELDITDGIYILNWLYLGGLQPPPPYPDCGADPTADPLGCDSYPPCQKR